MKLSTGRIGRILGISALLGTLFAWVPVGVAEVLASGGAANCRNDTTGWLVPIGNHQNNYFAAKNDDSANPHKWGLEGSYPVGYMSLDDCSGLGYGNVSASQIWSALEAGNAILQVGLIRAQGFGCDFGMPCDGQIHKFWTWGDCSGWNCSGPNGRGPEAIDLGVWDGRTHAFAIWSYLDSSGNPTWYPRIDGVVIRNSGWLPRTVANTSWLGPSSGVAAIWACETWDRGDACGGPYSNGMVAGSLVLQQTAGGPYVRNPVHSNVWCNRQDSLDPGRYSCYTYGNDVIDFFTSR
jgi:hypothetical protein